MRTKHRNILIFLLDLERYNRAFIFILNFLELDCQDNYRSCTSWAEKGDCANSYGFMAKYCKRVCNLCGNYSGNLFLIF